MVANHAQHTLTIFSVAVKRAVLRRKQRAGGVTATGENGGQRRAHRATFVAVVWNASLHKHGAQIGVSQTKRAIFPTALGDFLGWERGHQDANFKHRSPQTNRVLIALKIKGAGLRVVKFQQVNAGQVARGVVQEHVFAAWIAGVNAATGRACVPRVDGAVVLQSGIGALPRREINLLPQVARWKRL